MTHFIAKTAPRAAAENIILWGDYRVTVLDSRLFRIEHNAERKFRDDATQAVWFRDMPPQTFSVREEGDSLTVTTPRCALILKKKRADCRIVLNEKHIPIGNRGNLLGTCRTLDGCNGDFFVETRQPVKLGAGVCSRTGVAVYDDAPSLTLGGDGLVKAERGEGTDEYVFAYGKDYRAAVAALYSITGKPPLVPRFALGNWWSRYHVYTDREYLRILNRFEEENIPLSVATVDMDWHYSTRVAEELSLTEEDVRKAGGGLGWTGYTWNKNLFPDYRAFLKEVSSRGLKITLNLHPSEGVRRWEDCYPAMAEAMGKDPSGGETISFDIADPVFLDAYFSVLHRPYERDGVAFWWIDWQQGTTSSMDGLDPLWSLNHYHYLDNAATHAEPLILSRYAGIGSHRYPVGFSGDTLTTWRTLAYLPYFTATASNVGYSWWSHDIGGHYRGAKSGELYLRFLQYGVFSPVNRLHCCNYDTMTKEPWAYGGMGKIAGDYMRLRHKLIPYIYTQSYRLHTEGIPLIEPLYYRHPDDDGAYLAKSEYYFGSDFLVVPATGKAGKSGYTSVRAWLPAGTWTDFFTGDRYEVPAGGATYALQRTADEYPVFVREGTVLPLSLDGGNGANNPAKLEWRVYLGDGAFRLYEDDPAAGKVLFSHAKGERGEGVQRVTLTTEGDGNVIPPRTVRVSFPELTEGEIAVTRDGTKIAAQDVSSDCLKAEFPFEAGRTYSVEVRFREKTKLERRLARALSVLIRAEGDNVRKQTSYERLLAAKTEEEFSRIAGELPLPPAVLARLTETDPVD